MAEKIEFDFTVKNNGVSKALDEGVKKAFELEDALLTAVGVFGGNLITKGFDLLVSGFESIASVAGEAIDQAAESEVAINNLNNALGRAGNLSKEASDGLKEFADQVQATTTFEDDAVISSLALLQSLTRLNVEGLKGGATAAADFATVLGIDLETATRLVAKAANGSVDAFKRYGVEIKKGGDDTETFANTLKVLNSQFGGASQSQLLTYSGSLKGLANSYGGLLESIGDIVVGNPLFVASINAARTAITGVDGDAKTATKAIQEFTNDGIFFAASALEVFADSITLITVPLNTLLQSFNIVGSQIVSAIIQPFESAIDATINLGKSISIISGFFSDVTNPLAGATKAVDDFTNTAKKSLEETFNFDSTLSDKLRNGVNGIIDAGAQVSIAQNDALKNNQDNTNKQIEEDAKILASKKNLAAELLVLQATSASEEASLKTQLESTEAEATLASDLLKIGAIATQKIAEAQAVYDGELLKNQAIENVKLRQLTNEKAFEELRLKSIKITGQRELDEKNKINAAKIKSDKDYETNFASTLNSISTLQTSGNKTLIAVGKVAALAQIQISGAIAFGKALELGPIIGPPLAAATAVAFAAQAAKVVGVAFEGGGFIDGANGATIGKDNTTASVRSGEMVLNASQQGKLFEMLNNGGGGSSPIIVQIDGREVARAVRTQIENGFRLA